MFEKVNPSHPDKIADRIAGAIVDMAYNKQDNPRIAVEVLIGHGNCHIITESSVEIIPGEIRRAVYRITGTEDIAVNIEDNPQDEYLAKNQSKEPRCGDNGIFRGTPTSAGEKKLTETVRALYEKWPTDGKYIATDWKMGNRVIACQSQAESEEIEAELRRYYDGDRDVIVDREIIVNPLGYWAGGTNVDTGATNRKLGSDMGRAVTGGGLHGKDLTKADVSVNICAHILAQERHRDIVAACAIGDTQINFVDDQGVVAKVATFGDCVQAARNYIEDLGGFEKLAEWGLI